MMATCGDNGGRTMDGGPCTVDFGLSDDNGLCYHHDPDRAEERSAARKAGGIATAKKRSNERGLVDAPPPPQTIEDAKAYASWAVEAVASGRIDYRVGNTVQAILREFRSATEKVDLAKRYEALRKEVDTMKAKNRGGTR